MGVAFLESLLADGRTPLRPREAVELLYWLKEPDSVLRTLRESDGSSTNRALVAGLPIPDDSSSAAVLIRVRQIVLLRSHLEDLKSSMEAARNSHSSVLLREAAGRLDPALALATHSDRLWQAFRSARLVSQDIQNLISRLHRSSRWSDSGRLRVLSEASQPLNIADLEKSIGAHRPRYVDSELLRRTNAVPVRILGVSPT